MEGAGKLNELVFEYNPKTLMESVRSNGSIESSDAVGHSAQKHIRQRDEEPHAESYTFFKSEEQREETPLQLDHLHSWKAQNEVIKHTNCVEFVTGIKAETDSTMLCSHSLGNSQQSFACKASPLSEETCFRSSDHKNSSNENDNKIGMENPLFSVSPDQAENASQSDHSALDTRNEAPASDNLLDGLRLMQGINLLEDHVSNNLKKEPSNSDSPQTVNSSEPDHSTWHTSSEVPAADEHVVFSGEKLFKCDLCSEVFSTLGRRKQHRKTHSDNRPVKCDLCSKQFKCTKELNNHTMRAHREQRGEKVHKCEECGAAFRLSVQLKRHMSSHSDSRPFSCPQCTSRFKRSYSLKAHMFLHTGERPFHCQLCGKTFKTKTNLNLHTLIHSESRPYKCDLCPAQYKQPASLNDHKRSHSGKKPYKCEQCPAAFTRSSHLKDHKQMHSGYRPFKCDHCPAQFKRCSDLKRHVRTHALNASEVVMDSANTQSQTVFGCDDPESLKQSFSSKANDGGSDAPTNHRLTNSVEKPYVCDVCSKAFALGASLKRHMVWHSDRHPFQCDQCPAKFKRSDNLASHKMIHSGEKPYMCEVCAKAFVTKTNLHSHMKVHSEQRPFKCDQCSADFKRSEYLKSHLMTHAVEKPFKCELCPKAFSRLSRLKSHAQSHSDNRPFKCDLCTKQFQFSNQLNKHIKWVHRGPREKVHKCKECGAAFHQSVQLKRHMSSHSDSRPYSCPQCTSRFRRSYSLKAHLLLHTGERPFQCQLCGKTFQTKGNLNLHTLIHSESRPYKCDLCPAQYKQPTSLNDHKKTHSGRKPYKCEQCPAAFTRSTYLKRHKQMHVGHRPFKCDHCPAQFKRSNELKRHTKTHALNAKNAEMEGASKQSEPVFKRDNLKTVMLRFSSKAAIRAGDAGISVIQMHIQERDKGSNSQRHMFYESVEQREDAAPQSDDSCSHKAQNESMRNTGCVETKSGIQAEPDSAVLFSHGLEMNSQKTFSLKASQVSEEGCFSRSEPNHENGGSESDNESSMESPPVCFSPEVEDDCCQSDSNTLDNPSEATVPNHLREGLCLSQNIDDLEERVSRSQKKGPFILEGPEITNTSESDHSTRNTPNETSVLDNSKEGLRLTQSISHVEDPVSSSQKKEPSNWESPVTVDSFEPDHSTWNTASEVPVPDTSQEGFGLTQSADHLEDLVSSRQKKAPSDLEGPLTVDSSEPDHSTRKTPGETSVSSNSWEGLCSTQTVDHVEEHVSNSLKTEPSSLASPETVHFFEPNISTWNTLSEVAAAEKSSACPKALLMPQLFKRDLCSQASSTLGQRDQHLKIHANSDNKVSKRDLCSKQCKFSFELNNDIKRVHRGQGGEKVHKCEECGAAFRFVVQLRRHMSSHSDSRPFSCPQCTSRFKRSYSLKAHMFLHTGERPYQCQLCGKTFKTKTNLNLHILIHSESRPYKCDLCPAQYKQPASLNDHKRSHSGKKPYKCEQCPAAFTRSSYLKYHKQMHSGYRPFKCDLCPAQFRRRSDLKRHVRTHALNASEVEMDNANTQSQTVFGCDDPESLMQSFSSKANDGGSDAATNHRLTNSVEKPYVCDVCSKAFALEASLKRHMVWHSDRKPFQCDQCPAKFKRSDNLTSHKMIHSGEKPYMCEVCAKAFATKTNLRSHMKVHTEQRPFKCDQCSADFKRSEYLKSHLMTHAVEKPFKCELCPKAFSRLGRLKSHALSHSDNRSFKCDLCTKQFQFSSQLNKHIKWLHRGERSEPREKVHKCEECGAAFHQSVQLKRHMSSHSDFRPYSCPQCTSSFKRSYSLKAHTLLHGGERPFQCQLCGKTFQTKGNLNLHTLIHSENRPYKCDLCPAQYKQPTSLNDHMKTHSGKKPYKCEQCPAAFTRSTYLICHKRMHIGSRPFKCGQCVAQFKRSNELKRHETTHVGDKEKSGKRD